jgi:hypothetical protein
MSVGDQRHAATALPLAGKKVTHCTGGWMGPNGWSGRVRKIAHPPKFDSRAFQPVATRLSAVYGIYQHILSTVAKN